MGDRIRSAAAAFVCIGSLFVFIHVASGATRYEAGLTALAADNTALAAELFKESYLAGEHQFKSLLFLSHISYRRGDFHQARQGYRDIMARYGLSTDDETAVVARFMFAESSVKCEEFADAEQAYAWISSRAVDSPVYLASLYGRAYCLYRQKKYSGFLTAVSFLRQQWEDRNARPPAAIDEQLSFLVGDAWYQQGYYRNAERELRRFLREFPESRYAMHCRLRLARLLGDQKKYAQAEQLLREIPGRITEPDATPIVQYHLATMLMKQRRYEEAVGVLERIVRDPGPDRAFAEHVLLALGYGNLALKRSSRAASILSSINRTRSTTVGRNAQYLLGLACYCNRDYATAIRVFEKYRERFPRQDAFADEVPYWLGLSLMHSREYRRAVELFERLAARRSSVYARPAAYFVARCYREMQDFERAKRRLESLLETAAGPMRTDVLVELAECNRATCDYARAEELYVQVPGALTGAHGEAALGLADVYLRTERYPQAESLLRTLVSSGTSAVAASAKMLQFTLWYNTRQYDRAAALAEELLFAGPPQPTRRFLIAGLAKAHLARGRADDALKYLNMLGESDVSPAERFALEMRIVSLTCSTGSVDAALQRVRAGLSRFTDPAQRAWLLVQRAALEERAGDAAALARTLRELTALCAHRDAFRYCSGADVRAVLDLAVVHDQELLLAVANLLPELTTLPLRDRVSALLASAEYALGLKRYTIALRFAEAVNAIASDADAWVCAEYLIGRVEELTGSVSRAAERYRKIIQRESASPYIPRVYRTLISLYETAGDTVAVCSLEEGLVGSFPTAKDTAEYLFTTAERRFASKEYDEASRRYSQVLACTDPALQARAQKRIGDCRAAQGRHKEASVEYLKTIYLYPQFPDLCAEAQYLVGVSCEHLKLYDEARRAYSGSTKNYPGTLWAQEAEVRLKNLRRP